MTREICNPSLRFSSADTLLQFPVAAPKLFYHNCMLKSLAANLAGHQVTSGRPVGRWPPHKVSPCAGHTVTLLRLI